MYRTISPFTMDDEARSRDSGRLSARSVITSALLGSDPPSLTGGSLVRIAQLLGINEGAARVALTRMSAAGETELRDNRYCLAGSLLQRRTEVLSARAPAVTHSWDGTWTVVVIPGDEGRPRDQRAATRAELLRLHMGELRDGVWIRPSSPSLTFSTPIPGSVVFFERGQSSGVTPEHAASMWDLARWSERGRLLVAELRRSTALPVQSRDRLRAMFTAGSRALDQLTRDPMLPESLLPTDWPARELREVWQQCDREVRGELRRWLAPARKESEPDR
jgi:phenylacetic acid degradation operon negative regulatory protein